MRDDSSHRRTVWILGLALLGAMGAAGYDRYSINDNATNCRQCHGDFRSNNYVSLVDGMTWGNLHNIHRSTMLSGDCDVCHSGNDRFPVLIAESDGGDGFEPVSCVGCHGVNPDPGGRNNSWWGAGLRAHHTNAGVGPDSNGLTCMDCHDTDPPPPPESTMPSYYFTPDPNHPGKPTDPCNPAPGYPENYAGAVIGIDNDGDLLNDDADPDCAATPTPTPTATATSTPTNTPLPTNTPTPTPTSTPVPTNTPTPTPTNTPVSTNTHTPTPTNTSVPTDTHTPTPTNTSVSTNTHTPTPTPTSTPVTTLTPTPTPTNTSVPTDTHTPTPTSTSTPVVTLTPTPTPTSTPTFPPNPSEIFDDGFESGDTSAWS